MNFSSALGFNYNSEKTEKKLILYYLLYEMDTKNQPLIYSLKFYPIIAKEILAIWETIPEQFSVNHR